MSAAASSRTVSLIGAPTDVGASDRGASMGPEALRVAGLHAALAGRGLEVMDCGNLERAAESRSAGAGRISKSGARWRPGTARCTAPCIAS